MLLIIDIGCNRLNLSKQIIQYQFQRYSVDVWIDIEKYISREFYRVSESTNCGCSREYFRLIADECNEHAFALKSISVLIQDDYIDPIIYIKYPVNVMKKNGEFLKENSELINFLEFYSEIFHQISETYLVLSKKTESISASIILKKLSGAKKIQEGILSALILKFVTI